MDKIQFLIGGEEHDVGALRCRACGIASHEQNDYTVPCMKCDTGRIHLVTVKVNDMGIRRAHFACDQCEYEVG